MWKPISATLICLSLSAQTITTAIGVTRQQTPIPALLAEEDFDYGTMKTRILLIGGSKRVRDAFEWFHSSPQAAAFRTRFAVSAVPMEFPSGGYPPKGDAYGGTENPEAAYLWRWIGMHAPDMVVDVREAGTIPQPDGLVSQLALSAPSGTGTIPAMTAPSGNDFLRVILLNKANFRGPSPARVEIQRRLARTPLEVSRQLAVRYGHELPEAVYIPAVALMARLRLGELTKDPSHLAEVERIVAPYATGEKPSLGAKPTSSHLPGHLIFGELARATGKPRYLELARAAADMGFDEAGRPKESMPLHNEMSDSVFMGCPIAAQVGRLTGEREYYEMALRHMRFMLKLNLRRDGLHRHSPLDEAAWGRGNGFPALGLALSLSEIPEDYPGRRPMLAAFQAHMAALARHQDRTGAWHQVIDFPGSYRELTATCMIGFAMRRGVRQGWLDRAKYQTIIDRAWHAVRARVAADGSLVDVCTGTGKQRSLQDYLNRTAILGPDPRGGAMAFLFATELAR